MITAAWGISMGVYVQVNIDSLSVFGFCHPVKHSVDTGMNSLRNKSLPWFLTV